MIDWELTLLLLLRMEWTFANSLARLSVLVDFAAGYFLWIEKGNEMSELFSSNQWKGTTPLRLSGSPRMDGERLWLNCWYNIIFRKPTPSFDCSWSNWAAVCWVIGSIELVGCCCCWWYIVLSSFLPEKNGKDPRGRSWVGVDEGKKKVSASKLVILILYRRSKKKVRRSPRARGCQSKTANLPCWFLWNHQFATTVFLTWLCTNPTGVWKHLLLVQAN